MSERGRYRSITCALVNGPDYQRLTPEARLVLLTLKISFSPTGIEVRYPGVLLVELQHQTGYSVRTATSALQTLETERWIRRGDNLLWIVGQLRYEPQLHATNPRHVKSVRQHIQGLPRVPLVEAFKAEYAEYFKGLPIATAKATDSLSHSLPDSLSHSQNAIALGEGEGEGTGEGNRKVKRLRPARPRAVPEQPSWVQTLTELWVDKVGAVDHGRLGKALKPIVDKHGLEAVVAAVAIYASPDEGPKGVRSVNYFAADFQKWHTIAKTPLVSGGMLTERGQRIGAA